MATKDLQEDLAGSNDVVVNQSTVPYYWDKHDIHRRKPNLQSLYKTCNVHNTTHCKKPSGNMLKSADNTVHQHNLLEYRLL